MKEDLSNSSPSPASNWFLWFGQFLAAGGLILFSGALLHLILTVNSGADGLDASLTEDFLQQPYSGEFPVPMRLAGVFFGMFGSFTGVIAVAMCYRLFGAYRRGEIFTLKSARRLRLIGWLIALIAPVDILMNTLAVGIFSRWLDPSDFTVSVTLDDGHVYAAVFGLLIVVVAQVMVQATAISDENRAIV